MTKRPTIHDVARLAGVSKSLAAMVFKSETGVSEARRERVLRAAEDIGYTPNAWARSLRSSTGGFVGIIVADFHNPLFTEIADAARQRLASQGVFSFVATASLIDGPDGVTVDPEPIHHLLDLKPSSLFVVGGLPDLLAFARLPSQLPVVVALDEARALPRAVTIRTDESAAMSLIGEHLSELGHHTITYVGPEGRPVADVRRNAFIDESERRGFHFATVSSGSQIDEQAGLDATIDALESSPRPTAIVCFNDITALGAQSAISRAILDGEPDVAVIGFDNTYIAQLDRIALTSINQDVTEIVREAVALLTDAELFAQTTGREILVEPQLVVRSSTTNISL